MKRNIILLIAVWIVGSLAACQYAGGPTEEPGDSPVVVALAEGVASAERAMDSHEEGTEAYENAKRRRDYTASLLGLAVQTESVADAAQGEDPVAVGSEIATGAAPIIGAINPLAGTIAAAVGAILGGVAEGRRQRKKGAKEVASAINAGRKADATFDKAFDGKAGETIRAVPISAAARRAIEEAKAGR